MPVVGTAPASEKMTDDQVAWRYEELRFRMMECALTPDHPVTKANQARWTREFRQVEAMAERRGLLGQA